MKRRLWVFTRWRSKKLAIDFKLCLEHKVKRGKKVVKKELIVALRGEIYFVKFIINPEEDGVEPGVILGRSFLRMTKSITDFEAGSVTIYPDIDPFLEETEEEEKINDDWDHLLKFNIDDIPLLGEEELSPFVCKMGKSSRNKKRAMENLNFFYQEEAAKEALAIKISRKKVELDGKIVKEEEEAIKRIKGEALKEKYDPEAFIFPIRLEGQRGREEMKKVDRGITMINHTQAEAMGILTNVLCQVGATTLIAMFLILDIPINRDSPIVVGRGFLQSDSDDKEEYQIKRNKFGAPIYGPKPAPYLNCNDPAERSLAIPTTIRTHDDEAGPSRSKCSRQHETEEEVLLPQVHHEFLLWEGCNRDEKSRWKFKQQIHDFYKKTKPAKYDTIEGIEDMVQSLWSPVKVSYDKFAMWGISHWGPKRQHFYGYASNRKHASPLSSEKLSNLEKDDLFNLNVALRMFTRRVVILKRVEDFQLGVEKLPKEAKSHQAFFFWVKGTIPRVNLTKPETFKSDISKMTPYTAYNNPQGIIYQDKFKRNRLMRFDELYKFCYGTLSSVRRVLHDIASSLEMDYLPKRTWSKLDRKRSCIMIKSIDQ
ncbi:hypothetical protein Tco_1300800 [Tanacetum coccineum]